MAEAVLDELRAACHEHARAADDSDAVDGVPARFVASPSSSEQTSAVLKVAGKRDLAVVVRGTGTRLWWGAPPRRLDIVLDTRRMDRVVEHAAGDLIVVVGAGRTVVDLQSDLATAGQRLAVEPPRGGTVGGIIAAAVSGPNRLLHGPVRDLVIGATIVRGDGVIAHSGGKVVKNVAGYDLGKLMTGSFGTLAVVTQAAFRLHPIAPGRAWFSVGFDGSDQVHAALQRLVHSQVVPTAIELDRPAAAGGSLAVLIEAAPDVMAHRLAQVQGLIGDGTASDTAPRWWGTEPFGDGDGDVALRLTHEISRLPQLLAATDEAATRSGLGIDLRGSVAVGSLYAAIHRAGSDPVAVATAVGSLRSRAASFGGTVVVLDAPSQVKAELDLWGPVGGLDLMRRVKDQFDPAHRLAPGRFVGGI